MKYISVFSPDTEKYGQEKTFHAVRFLDLPVNLESQYVYEKIAGHPSRHFLDQSHR